MAAPAPWRALIVHGAGSTGATAAALMQPLLESSSRRPWTPTVLEDRTGQVEMVTDQVARWLRSTADTPGGRVVAGISLGAHAAILGTGRVAIAAQPTCVIAALPAWLGPPDATAELTQRAATEIADIGIRRTMARIRSQANIDRNWVVAAIQRDWTCYTDEALSRSLAVAALGRAPDATDLEQVGVPVLLLGIEDDPLHPRDVLDSWARHLHDGRVAIVDPHTHSGFASPAAVGVLAGMLSDPGCGEQMTVCSAPTL